MTVVITKRDTPAQIAKKLKKLKTARKKVAKKKGFNAKKYSKYGDIFKNLYGDPLEYQKRLRDEWER